MAIHFPAQVVAEGLHENFCRLPPVHGHVMLKAVAAHMVQQGLQVVHLAQGDTAGRRHFVSTESSFSDIGLDAAVAIVRGDFRERHRSFGNLRLDGAEGVLLTQRGAQHIKGADFHVFMSEETPRKVGAVQIDAIFSVISDLYQLLGID